MNKGRLIKGGADRQPGPSQANRRRDRQIVGCVRTLKILQTGAGGKVTTLKGKQKDVKNCKKKDERKAIA